MSQFDFKREKEVFDQLNVYRKQYNLEPYKWNDFIANLARQHSQQMAEKHIAFSHDGIEQRLKSIKDANSHYSGASENVSYSKPGDLNPVGPWSKSQHHNENMLGNFTHGGIGLVSIGEGDGKEWYYTGIFAKLE